MCVLPTIQKNMFMIFTYIYICMQIHVYTDISICIQIYLCILSFLYFKYIFYLHQNFNILFARQQFFAGLLPSLAHPAQHFFNTSVVMCTCCGTHLFDSCTIFSRGFHSMKKHPPLFTKVPLYNFQRFKVSFFTNIILRNTTFFTKIQLCCLCTH